MRVHAFGPFWGVVVRVLPLSDVWAPVWAPGVLEGLGLPDGLYATLLDGAQAVPFCWTPSLGWAFVGSLAARDASSLLPLGGRPFLAMVSRLRGRTVGLDPLEEALRSCLGDPSSLLLQLEVMAS